MVFEINQEFNSFIDFEKAKSRHENEKFFVYVIDDSKTLKRTNKTQVSIDDIANLRYQFIKYKCKAHGLPPNGDGNIRNTFSFRKNCLALLTIRLHRRVDNTYCLRIDAIHEEHTHELSRAAYMALPRQRRRSIDVNNAFVHGVLGVKPNMRLVQNELNESKNVVGEVTLKDLYNRKAKLNKTENMNPIENVTDLEALICEMKKIPGATVKVIENDNNVEGIFFQDENMKKQFEMFPEVLMVDASCKLQHTLLMIETCHYKWRWCVMEMENHKSWPWTLFDPRM